MLPVIPLLCVPPDHAAGQMSDAAEVLLCVYERVMEVAGGLGRPSGIDATFGLVVREEVHCHRCGKVTHQSSYTQYFHNTQVRAARASGPKATARVWRLAMLRGNAKYGLVQLLGCSGQFMLAC